MNKEVILIVICAIQLTKSTYISHYAIKDDKCKIFEFDENSIQEKLKNIHANLSKEMSAVSRNITDEIEDQFKYLIEDFIHRENGFLSAGDEIEKGLRMLSINYPHFMNSLDNATEFMRQKSGRQIKSVLEYEIDRSTELKDQSTAIVRFYKSIFMEPVDSFRKQVDLLAKNMRLFNTKMANLNPVIIKIEKKLNYCQKSNNYTTQEATVKPQSHTLPKNCYEERERTSGITNIQPGLLHQTKKVYCNHSYEGGGWTVVLQRTPQETQLDFRRTFKDYQLGFGDLEAEHWIGLQTLHRLTGSEQHELYVRIATPQEEAFAKYYNFSVGEAPGYKLKISNYDQSSSGGDALSYHNGRLFSTYDRDQDLDPVRSCSTNYGGGGFWFNLCYHANPTGIYPPKDLPPNTALHSLLEWRRWKGFHVHHLSHLIMMIRPTEP